jgi:2-oxoisovalerate dehydrogenase E1 component
MARQQKLDTNVPWVQLSTSAADWKNADPELLKTMLGELQLIRSFEETVLDLAREGLVHGPAHSSIGQEGGAVGSVLALQEHDAVNGSHRGHHQFLAKSISYISRGVLDPDKLISNELQDVLKRTLAEILGLAQGFSGGRGGSLHLQWLEAGALGTNAIVGGGVPLAGGAAWAQQYAGTDHVTATYFGDGASQIGSVLESMNLAATWKVPLLFFIENNQYAVSTHASEITADSRFSVRGQGFGIPAWRVDGMDPLAVYIATKKAAEHMRTGNGPTLIEADVYRYFHQNGPYPGSAFGYRSKQEEAEWKARDPLTRVAAEVTKLGILSEEQVTGIREQAETSLRKAVESLIETDPDSSRKRRRIKPSLWPETKTIDEGIRSDLSEIETLRAIEPRDLPGEWKKTKFVSAVSNVLQRRMEEDSRIIVLGEDVHKLGGGTNGATKGLIEAFGPTRVVGTPISENSFFGFAGGAALDGRIRPVVEFMYPDFMWVAADQVFNQIGKARHMFGNNTGTPLVLRTKVAMGAGYGSQHLMDPAGVFATQPGWRIVAASNAADYIGLMNAALAIDDPVLVIEHVDLYGKADAVPSGELDYIIPPQNAAIRRSGKDLTILTYLSMVDETLDAVEGSDVDAEVIDLRWLDKASLDWETIGNSIRKTNAVLIAEQGARGVSYGNWLASALQERYFDWLDQPIQRVTGSEASPPVSEVLERAAIAKADEVKAGLRRVREAMGGDQ